MVATVVEVESGQSQPPLLGAVAPVADLDAACHGPALLRTCPTGHDAERHRLILVPVGDRSLENARPRSIQVASNLKCELGRLAGPVVAPCLTRHRRRHDRRWREHEGHGERGHHEVLGESPRHGLNSRIDTDYSRALNRIIASLVARDCYVAIVPLRAWFCPGPSGTLPSPVQERRT